MNRPMALCLGGFALLGLVLSVDGPSRAQTTGSAAAPVPVPPAAARFAYGGDAAEIPAEFVGNIAFLPVRVNLSRSSFFVLDSTTAASSIDPGRLSALGLSATEAPVLNLPGVDLPFTSVSATPRNDFASEVGRAFEGSLGNDFFERVVVEIDYARHTVRLYDPGTYHYSGQGLPLPLTFADGLPVVRVKFTDLKGKLVEGSFVVSTLLDASTVIFDRYAQSHHIISSHGKTIPSVDPVLNGSGGAVVSRLKGMQIGRYTAQDMLVTFSSSDLPGASDPHIAGVIGAAMLSRFTVAFDYPHEQLIVAPNSQFSSDDQEDKSGISVVARGAALKRFEVIGVAPGTPAAKAGIQKGDIIAGIDEDAAADLDLAEIRGLFRQIGHKYNLAIDRNGQSKQILIEMRRLLSN